MTDEMTGEIVVFPNENAFSLGYAFSYRHHRQGYAFEALSVLINSLHETFPDWEFSVFTDPKNQAGMGLLVKPGYRNLSYIPPKESQAFGKWVTDATVEEFRQADTGVKSNTYSSPYISR